MQRKLVFGLALVALSTSLVLAKMGTVETKDGKTYTGDVTEKGDTVEISGIPNVAGPVGINKANVKSINYPEDVGQQILDGLKKLDAKDINTRISMARLAIDKGAYEAAKAALHEAELIEPNNAQVAEMMKIVLAHLPPPTTHPTSNPAGVPAVAQPAIPLGAFLVKRTLFPGEINRIRQLEWPMDDPSPDMKVAIDAATRNKFLAGNLDITAAQFNTYPPQQQAAAILQKGAPELQPGVKIATDPPSIRDYKTKVNNFVLQSCAGCHSGNKNTTTFTLIAGNNDAAVYTNFLELQRTSHMVDGVVRLMVDRVNPESSLLLQFALQPNLTATPHPPIKGGTPYKGAIRAKSAPGYAAILSWIQGLNPVMPKYSMDLSHDPAADKKN